MNPQLLGTLICPLCKSNLELIVFDDGVFDECLIQKRTGEEVISGGLICKCKNIYPIIEGVPRFLDGGICRFPGFIERHRKQLEQICGNITILSSSVETDKSEDFENIRKSFSEEWGLFDYDSDKTWGWTIDERKGVFLQDVKANPNELVGKYMLDAGCGNGTLTSALSDFDLRVVGMDLSDRLGLAYYNRSKFAEGKEENIQFVQGNILTPPLKEEMFDLVYSSGVIHHTPNSKKAFASLVRLTKKGGRLYIWVYGKRALPVRFFQKFGRDLKQRISLRSLVKCCRFISPFYKIGAKTLNFLGIMSFRSRNTREITLDLFDAFAPKFNHWHTEDEVRTWFQEFGFKNINLSVRQKHGFGMYGDRT